MKAIITQKEILCKDEKVQYWEIKVGKRLFAKICFPWSANKDFKVEFYKPNLVITDIEDIHAAVEKCQKYCAEFYNITEITDSYKYPIELLACFADPLFD